MINAQELFHPQGDWPLKLSYSRGWVPARPLPGPFVWRLRDAWAVLTGRAEAVCFPGNDDLIPSAPQRERNSGEQG